MDDEQKLELMKSLADMPQRPGFLPTPTVYADDPYVEVPIQIKEYVEATGGTIGLEEDGRIHIGNYLKLLQDYSLTHLMISLPTIIRTYSEDDIEVIKGEN
ncbi:hypothetical protein [Flagellimonas allohymeniacidonis]|uniref:Uncharacterized protein n=1 Tax=Flagellimonas allohymeniacidonis TaxID=2517819 RepID=A0A4Q8QF45_9FLAO|nr:hypothetical protein [Allomuricauda hymeniacidonis]TAI48464.1 hypothetical protein EW142_01275 [Allomuricauda hymeniacidonis]